VADNISKGQPQFSITQQGHRFVAEGRKGCEAAQYPDDQKCPGFRWNDPSLIGEFRKEADERAAKDIDGQGAERELNALAQVLSIAAHKIAQDGPNEPACADEKQCAQNVTLSKCERDCRAIVLK
jgi:hypothetical protein